MGKAVGIRLTIRPANAPAPPVVTPPRKPASPVLVALLFLLLGWGVRDQTADVAPEAPAAPTPDPVVARLRGQVAELQRLAAEMADLLAAAPLATPAPPPFPPADLPYAPVPWPPYPVEQRPIR